MRAISSVRQRPGVLAFMLVVLGLALVVPFVGPQVTRAQDTIMVTNTADAGAGSLRWAIEEATDGDIITFAAGLTGTIELASQLTINKNLTIAGPGADVLTVSGNDAVRPFLIDGATVEISGLTISRGAEGSGSGGGIANRMGTLTITDSAITGNTATSDGGGIYNYQGTLTITGSIISGNSTASHGGGIRNDWDSQLTITDSIISDNTAAYGGGISSPGALTITNSTISDNTAAGLGGGIYSLGTLTITNSTIAGNTAVQSGGIHVTEQGTLTATNSTISGNTASSFGGGITTGGTSTIVNSTISGNAASFGGGGILNEGSLTIVSSTIAGNAVTDGITDGTGGGIWNLSFPPILIAQTMLTATIVANNAPGDNCSGEITSEGHNLSSDTTCFTDGGTDLLETNPLLGDLTDNGGPTPTHALAPASPAVNAIPAEVCEAALGTEPVDQRGAERPQFGACDIGAFELDLLAALIADTTESTIPAFLKPRLLVFLTTADLALERGNTAAACHALQQFSEQITALSPHYITPVLAEQLTSDAQRIRTILGC